MAHLHEKTFPGESRSYRQARNILLAAELELEDKVRQVNDLRHALPAGGPVPMDYEFDRHAGGGTEKIKLSALFAPDKNALFLYSFMYSSEMDAPCPACTSLIDSLSGAARHFCDRINFAVVAKSPIERLTALAQSRGWDGLQMLSSAGNTYNADYFCETETGNQIPAANVFVKSDDGIRHFTAAEMLFVKQPGHPRHVDRIWPVWNVLDLVPEGRGRDWFPKLDYGD